MLAYRETQTDRQTDRETDTLIAVLCALPKARVCDFVYIWSHTRRALMRTDYNVLTAGPSARHRILMSIGISVDS